MFTARYGLSSYITRIRLVHKGLTLTLREISDLRNPFKQPPFFARIAETFFGSTQTSYIHELTEYRVAPLSSDIIKIFFINNLSVISSINVRRVKNFQLGLKLFLYVPSCRFSAKVQLHDFKNIFQK